MPTQSSKRPSLEAIPAASSSSSNLQLRHSQAVPLYPLFASLVFHIVPAKLDNDIGVLYQSVEDLGGKCDGIESARWVITALKGRARLGRVLGKWMDKKTILTPEYIYETYTRAIEASTKRDTIPRLPNINDYLVIPVHQADTRILTDSSDEDDPDDGASRRKRRRIDSDDLPDMEPFEEDVELEGIPRYCVERASPLICVNQDLIDAIKPIYESRLFEERGQMNSNVLSYRRSMSVIKCRPYTRAQHPIYTIWTETNNLAIPRPIKSGKEAMRIQDVGERVATRIDEFLQTGAIAESQEILSSPRFQAMQLFASIFTIGHTTAKTLYDKYNCRTLEDVREHYEAITEEKPEVREKDKVRRRLNGGMKQVEIVEAWMGLKEDLDESIPREEVEEIARCVKENLDAIMPGCRYTLTGGYRRGKTKSNDVDVVFCPPHDGDDNGLLRDLYRRMTQMGIITHVLQLMDRQHDIPVTASANNFDNLDKAFVIFKLPGRGRLHRRVDLISAPKERYAAAVLSWSGSMMFERDLKRYAEDRGYKFRAGLIEASTGREIHFEKERDIFHHLGLRYVPPHLRNADG